MSAAKQKYIPYQNPLQAQKRTSGLSAKIYQFPLVRSTAKPISVIADSEYIYEFASASCEFKYTDKELDEDSGLYYFQARYYDPMGGRFLGRDKIRLESMKREFFQLNEFHYCRNNPVRNIDPDGNFNFGGFADSIGQGFKNDGLLGAAAGGLGNLGENFSNLFTGKGFQDNKELTRVLNFNGSTLTATNGCGDKLNSWAAKGSAYTNLTRNDINGPTPTGKYRVGNIEATSHPRMIGNEQPSLGGWCQDMAFQGDNWPANRTAADFHIHPDTGNDGTAGCVGVNPDQSADYYKWFNDYRALNPSTEVFLYVQ